jgi:NAD(P)H-dependent FMN reductase
MKKLITIPGSSSKNSINKQLAEYVGSLVQNVKVMNIDLNDYKIPLFSVDENIKNGFSEDLLTLNSVIEEADAIVISLAEHNGAYATAFKNIFDWLSIINGKVWREKPMLLLATSPGERGGATVLEIAKGRFPYNGGNIIGSLSVPSFQENFKDGEIVNSEIKTEVKKLVNKLEENL